MHLSLAHLSLFRYLNFTSGINSLERALSLTWEPRAGPSVATWKFPVILDDRVAGSLYGFQDQVLTGLHDWSMLGFFIMSQMGPGWWDCMSQQPKGHLSAHTVQRARGKAPERVQHWKRHLDVCFRGRDSDFSLRGCRFLLGCDMGKSFCQCTSHRNAQIFPESSLGREDNN